MNGSLPRRCCTADGFLQLCIIRIIPAATCPALVEDIARLIIILYGKKLQNLQQELRRRAQQSR